MVVNFLHSKKFRIMTESEFWGIFHDQFTKVTFFPQWLWLTIIAGFLQWLYDKLYISFLAIFSHERLVKWVVFTHDWSTKFITFFIRSIDEFQNLFPPHQTGEFCRFFLCSIDVLPDFLSIDERMCKKEEPAGTVPC